MASRPMRYKLLRDVEMLKHKLLAHSYGSHGADLNSLFDHIDRNHSGVIEREDMVVMIRDIVPHVAQFELDAFLAIMDSSNKGYISREEFVEFVKDRQSLHSTEKYEEAMRRFTADMDISDDASPQPNSIMITPATQAASAAKLSKPLDRHKWKGVAESGPDYRVTSCHKGRQRPGYKHPILHRKEVVEKEYGLGYSDPEKDAWDELREQMIMESSRAHVLTSAASSSFHQPSSSSSSSLKYTKKEEVPASVIWTDSKIKRQDNKCKKFKVSLSEFDSWLVKNREWNEKAKEHAESAAEKMRGEKGVVPPAFLAKETPKLASKAYERYRQAFRSVSKDTSADLENVNSISALTEDIVQGNIDVGDNIKELLSVIPFEVLPVHERLSLEAKYYASRSKKKADQQAIGYEPPKVLRKSKQILLNTPRKSLVEKENDLLKANNSIHLETPNHSSSEFASIDIKDLASSMSSSDISAIRHMMRSSSADNSDKREKSGFGFSSPRFLNASPTPGRNPNTTWGLTEQSAQISWSPAKNDASDANADNDTSQVDKPKKGPQHLYASKQSNRLVRESFQDRLARSVSAHHARKSYEAEKEYRKFGNPGPGHYELPTDPIKSVQKNENLIQNVPKQLRPRSAFAGRNNVTRSTSPGVFIGSSSRECNNAFKRVPTSAKIASMIKTASHEPRMTAKQKYHHDMAVHRAVVASHGDSIVSTNASGENKEGSVTSLDNN